MWLYRLQKSSTVVTVIIGLWFSSHVRVLSFLKNQRVQAFCKGCFITFSGSAGAVSAIFMLSTISVISSTSFTLEFLSKGTGLPTSTAAADMVEVGVVPDVVIKLVSEARPGTSSRFFGFHFESCS